MKALLALNIVFLTFAISRSDDCGLRAMTAAIELYKDFDALHSRACHDLKINMDMYLVLRKKCVKRLIYEFDYQDFIDLAIDFSDSDCYRMSAVHTCSDQEYSKFKHCAFDFGMDHLDDGLRFYKNHTLMVQLYRFGLKSKECLTKSLDEIEANHRFVRIDV